MREKTIEIIDKLKSLGLLSEATRGYSDSFTSSNWCGTMGCPSTHIFDKLMSLKNWGKIDRWIHAWDLMGNSKEHGIAVLMPYEGEYTWCHVSEDMLGTYYHLLSLKNKRKFA